MPLPIVEVPRSTAIYTGERMVPTTVYSSPASASSSLLSGSRVMVSPMEMSRSSSIFSSTTHSSARAGILPSRSNTSLMPGSLSDRTFTTASALPESANASMTYSPSAFSLPSCARSASISSSVRPRVEST